MRATTAGQRWAVITAAVAVLISVTTGFRAEPTLADGNRPKPVQAAKVDVIELNHFRTDPRLEFTSQYIFWRRCPIDGAMLPMAWNSFSSVRTDLRSPDRRRGRFHWTAAWREDGRNCEVTAAAFRETWTEFDPESECRPLLEARGLRQNTIFPDQAADRFLADNEDTAPPAAPPDPPR